MSSKGLRHLNCSSIAIVWEKLHVNADEIRWIRQLWSKPHCFASVWFSCGSAWQQVLKLWSHCVFWFIAAGVCHYMDISRVTLSGFLFADCWSVSDRLTQTYTFISCRRTMWSLYSPSVNFFLFPLGLISLHVLESSAYHSEQQSMKS